MPRISPSRIPVNNGKLKISVANCDGMHSHDEPWNPSQAEKIFALSKEHGVPIEAVEFVNEPNMLKATGFPKDYTAADFHRDQDLFHKWVREYYPECLIVGPSDTDPGAMSVAYLGAATHAARCFSSYRDKYCPGGEMWVTESGDAGAGGYAWASTYLEVPRTLNEIGDFATVTNGVFSTIPWLPPITAG